MHSGWSAKTVLCWRRGKDGASPGNVPWEWCGGEGKALRGAPALRQWEGKGTSKTDDTGTVRGPCPHTHKKRLYWAGYRETRICQPRLLARMKHSELSWLIIEFNPTLWGIKYIQSPPCYWHVGSSWRKCLQNCQIAENWEKHKHLCTLLPPRQGLKAVLILDPDFLHLPGMLPASTRWQTPALSSSLLCSLPSRVLLQQENSQSWRGWGSYTADAHYDMNSVKPFLFVSYFLFSWPGTFQSLVMCLTPELFFQLA